MFKKLMTTAMAIAAVAGAVAGSSKAKALLQENQWMLVEGAEEPVSESSARAECPGEGATCAYEIDAEGAPTGNQFFKN